MGVELLARLLDREDGAGRDVSLGAGWVAGTPCGERDGVDGAIEGFCDGCDRDVFEVHERGVFRGKVGIAER